MKNRNKISIIDFLLAILPFIVMISVIVSVVLLQWSCNRWIDYGFYYKGHVSSQIETQTSNLTKRIEALEKLVLTNENSSSKNEKNYNN